MGAAALAAPGYAQALPAGGFMAAVKARELGFFFSQKKNPLKSQGVFYFVAPRDGLEPPTKWLTATRSTS